MSTGEHASRPVAVVTGASQGLGLALARRAGRPGLGPRGRRPAGRPPRRRRRRPPHPDARDGGRGRRHRPRPPPGAGRCGPGPARARPPAGQQRQHAGRVARCRPSASSTAEVLDRTFAVNVTAPRRSWPGRCSTTSGPAGTIVNITSDAAVEAYEGWGGLRLVQGGARARRPACWPRSTPSCGCSRVDPGDLRTEMHQDAFPGEDICDRPLARGRRARAAGPDRGRPAQRPVLGARPWPPLSVSARSRVVTPLATSTVAPFTLDPAREAHEPPEARGLPPGRRPPDGVGRRDAPGPHPLPATSPTALDPGDLVVVNTSATVAAAVDGRLASGEPVAVHVSGQLPGGLWLVEVRQPDGRHHPAAGPRRAPVGALRRRRVRRAAVAVRRLAAAVVRPLRPAPAPSPSYLAGHGRADPLPLRRPRLAARPTYQTVFSVEPGSAEMPSAARPFTPRSSPTSCAGAITIAPLLLHTGVSSLEGNEAPYPERYRVPPATARAGQRRPRRRRPGRRHRHHRGAGAGDGHRRHGRRPPRRGLDRGGHHARARRAGRRRPAHRLARARGVAPADARGRRRPPARWSWPTGPPTTRATSGTSSATATCCCRFRPSGAAVRHDPSHARTRGTAAARGSAQRALRRAPAGRGHGRAGGRHAGHDRERRPPAPERAGRRRPGRGHGVGRARPASGAAARCVYCVTPEGDALFPKAYGELTNELLGFLDDEEPETVNRLFARRRDARTANANARLAPLDTLEAKVDELTRILDEDGYLASWDRRARRQLPDRRAQLRHLGRRQPLRPGVQQRDRVHPVRPRARPGRAHQPHDRGRPPLRLPRHAALAVTPPS